MRTLALAACLVAGVVAQEPEPRPTELEKLRQEVAAKKKELVELQEMDRLRKEVEHLKLELVRAGRWRLHPADIAHLKAEAPRLRAELKELAETARLQREAAALTRRIAWERLSPKEKKKLLASRERKRQKIVQEIIKRETRIDENRHEITGCEDYIARIRKTHHTFKGLHIRSKKDQIKNCQRKIATDQKNVRGLQADLEEFNYHPGGEVHVQPAAQAAGVVDQAALNLRPSWLHRNLNYGAIVPVRAPDGTWWTVRLWDGPRNLFSMFEFGKGSKGSAEAIAWAERVRRETKKR